MKLNLETGLIEPACYIASQNHDAREHEGEPEVIILHCISLPPGEYGTDCVQDLFCNQLDCTQHSYFQQLENLRVSSHFFIRRFGELMQFVPTHRRAWHAGESMCLGRTGVNNFSIGIELEGLDTDQEGFTTQQYKQLNKLISVLRSAYPAIKAHHLFAHSDIAPTRKNDPGAYFNWNLLNDS